MPIRKRVLFTSLFSCRHPLPELKLIIGEHGRADHPDQQTPAGVALSPLSFFFREDAFFSSMLDRPGLSSVRYLALLAALRSFLPFCLKSDMQISCLLRSDCIVKRDWIPPL